MICRKLKTQGYAHLTPPNPYDQVDCVEFWIYPVAENRSTKAPVLVLSNTDDRYNEQVSVESIFWGITMRFDEEY